MKPFKDCTIKEYSHQLSAREPVPGGGSAAAVSCVLGASLLEMVVRYSLGRSQAKSIDEKLSKKLLQIQKARLRLLDLITEDSEAYLGVVQARRLDVKSQKKAARQAAKVPQEICTLSYELVTLTPFIVERGNPHLMSDVEVALELLLAGYHSAIVMVKINQ